MSSDTSPRLKLIGICKQFPGVRALDQVSLSVYPGETLALVGENGAGKSTLMKIIAGVYQPESGTIELNGEVKTFPTVIDAMRMGISLIHQELNLAENLTVAANLFLGREKTWGSQLKLLDRKRMNQLGIELLKRVGLSPDLIQIPVAELAPGEKQLVEIARALALSAEIIIMDEPTSSLTQGETDRLYEVIAQLKANQVSVIYISHRLAEINRIADRVVVLRDGRNAGELSRTEISHEAIIKRMVGRDLKEVYPRSKRPSPTGKPRLEIRNLVIEGRPATPVSFSIYPGEIVGMAGLMGAGRSELAEAVFGIRSILSGEIFFDGKLLPIRSTQSAIDAGILLVPEDRRLHGLVLESGVDFNLSLPNLKRLSTWSFVSRRRERIESQKMVERLRIKTPTLSQSVGLLSGGNQQKVVFGKWLARNPALLILDEPTRGVDVGARSEIYAIVEQLAQSGVAIWMISSDLEEVLGMSDRVLVLHEGHLTGNIARNEMNEETIMNCATGNQKISADMATAKGAI